MKTVGIIAEYDPFHSGHLYHLQQARARAGADYVVVVMSGNFVQRGEPALLDKWVRARMALEAGADLVLELPVSCACGSAEYFARGGVGLLHALGCVDALSFGCETDDLSALQQAAHFFAGPEPEQYRALLKEKLRSGISFPRARAQAFAEYRSCGDVPAILSQPNNILAIEYIKAILQLNSAMEVIPIKRLGAYHATDHPEYAGRSGSDAYTFASASLIRAKLAANGFTHTEYLEHQLPDTSLALLQEELEYGRFLLPRDLDLILHEALLAKREQLANYLDVDEELANRMRGCLNGYTGFASFAAQVQSRQYTLARIRRALLHVLLDIKQERPVRQTAPAFARVLGFRRDAQPLLHRIRSCSAVPLVTKLPREILEKGLEEDLHASQLWELLLSHKTGLPLRNERQRQLIIL